MAAAEPQPSLFDRFLEKYPRLALWVGRNFLHLNRLDKIPKVVLGAPIADAIALYGEPLESEPSEEFPEATSHTFYAGPFHEAVINEWEGKIHLVTYWSRNADPVADLSHMFQHYGDGMKWNALTAGYLYVRDDQKYWIWCSAVPAIGIQTTEFQVAKREYKKANCEA